MLFAGRSGLTVTTFGAATSMATGAKDFDRVVRQRVEPRIDRARQRHDQQRMAVLRRIGDEFAADNAAGAAANLDDDLLAEPIAEMLAQ